MKHLHLAAWVLLAAVSPAFSQKSGAPGAQDKWKITGQGPTEFLTDTRKATFHDKVHLDALPEMELDCELMTATMGEGDNRKFEIVEADKNVVIKIYETKAGKRKTRIATADHAVYHVSSNIVTLTGNARFEDEMGTFSAAVIHYNRTTGDMRSEGQYKLEGKPRPDVPAKKP